MAAPLKDLLNENVVRALARRLHRAHSEFAERGFDEPGFVRACLGGLDALELTGRAWQIAEAMQVYLPKPFAAGAKVLMASLGAPLEGTEELAFSTLTYMPHVFWVQKYGLDDFETAMHAQYELTQRFSAEFSIRAYLVAHPQKTYERLVVWSSDTNPHVRRLVSEGTRPRLPWAPRLRAFQEDPTPVLALLERLKDDNDRYVQRSVANNLNDIAKDHPDLVVEVCKRWLGERTTNLEGRKWIVGHATRSLVKQGNKGALMLLGAGDAPSVGIEDVKLGTKTKLGGELGFTFKLVSKSEHPQSLLVDYVAHFVKANGKTSPKVFKLKRVSLDGRSSVALRAKISFAQKTTRQHYPGTHRVDVLVNGVEFPLGDFEVLA